MEGRRGRGRPRTRNRDPVPDPLDGPLVNASEAGSAGPEVQRVDLGPRGGPNRDRDLDDRLIAAYERGRQAERREVAPEAPRGAPEEFRRLYDSFMRLNPPRFDGTGEMICREIFIDRKSVV